jgi:hypothetical protein
VLSLQTGRARSANVYHVLRSMYQAEGASGFFRCERGLRVQSAAWLEEGVGRHLGTLLVLMVAGAPHIALVTSLSAMNPLLHVCVVTVRREIAHRLPAGQLDWRTRRQLVSACAGGTEPALLALCASCCCT